MSNNTKPLLRAVLLLIGGLFLLVCLLGLGFVGWFHYGDRGGNLVEAKLQGMRNAGLPIDDASMEKWYLSRTDASDTMLWLRIFKTLQSPELLAKAQGIEEFDGKARDTKRTAEGWPGEVATRKLLDETVDLRAEIHTLAQKRVHVQFPLKFDSANTSMDHLQPLRQAARLIALEADVAIQDRNSAQILASSQTLFDLAIVPGGDSNMVSQLVSIAIRSLGMSKLKEALEQDLLDAKELELLAARLPKQPLPMDSWHETIQSERAWALPIFSDPRKYLKGQNSGSASQIPMSYRAASQDYLNYLEFMERFEAMGDLPMADAIEQSKALEDELKKNLQDAGILGTREWMLTGMFAPALISTMTVHCRDRQQVHIVLHGVAIRRYQDQFGDLPQDLLALKDIGFDTNAYPPIGSKPFGYLLEADGATLWGTDPLTMPLETSGKPLKLDPTNSRYELMKQLLWKLKK